MTAADLRKLYVETALRYVGTTKGSKAHEMIVAAYNTLSPLPRGYKAKTTDAYCAEFVTAVSVMLRMESVFPVECGAWEMGEKAKEAGIWYDRSYTPLAGDVIFYTYSHVGIVTGILDGKVQTVEGNIDGGKTGVRNHSLDDSTIRGYASPDYAVLADDSPVERFPFVGIVQTAVNLRTSPVNFGSLNKCKIELPDGKGIRSVLYPGESVTVVGESVNWWQVRITGERYTWTPWIVKTADGRDILKMAD